MAELFLSQYLYQEGSSEGGRWPMIAWLCNQSRITRNHFGSYLVYVVALENKVLK